jgi:hypothetical protein
LDYRAGTSRRGVADRNRQPDGFGNAHANMKAKPFVIAGCLHGAAADIIRNNMFQSFDGHCAGQIRRMIGSNWQFPDA